MDAYMHIVFKSTNGLLYSRNFLNSIPGILTWVSVFYTDSPYNSMKANKIGNELDDLMKILS